MVAARISDLMGQQGTAWRHVERIRVTGPKRLQAPYVPTNAYKAGITVKGFIDFIRKQGVVGLAVGFILGGAVSKVVSSLVQDIVNPLVGLLLGKVANLSEAYLQIGAAKIMWGNFVSVLLDFVVVAAVVYFVFKKLGIEKLDSK